ncbi:nuclear transport factor 2 family protein [Hyphococcus sp.]|jgi:ketosteroid isomerase-like protein|uniref:YybH family protein n=1 Tax=Hyphococcus sp. TaxID=2038636 RepID=UPI003D10A5C1
MKHAATASALIAALAASGAFQNADAKTTCTRGSDARVIEVISPGSVGQSCDVRYTRGGGANISVPYHADNSDSFCNQKASEMAKRLALSGFVCVQSAPALRADASPSASDYVVEAKRPSPSPAPASEPVAVAQAPQETPVEAPASVAEAQPAPSETVTVPAPASQVAPSEIATVDDAALEDEMNKILAQPAVAPVAGEPAQLVAQHAETPSRPQPTPVGRLVGAEPEAPRPAAPVTQASVQIPVPSLETDPAPAEAPSAPELHKAAPAAQPAPAAPKAATPSKLREPADVIRATLMAQAAAWNEGDLDGFMESYWKSDELKFVSGGTVTKGWNATMKRYRDRYAGGEGLGQLAFDKLEVKLVTEDVATVTGRFNLARGGNTSAGSFSLVMRRDAGAWKIVHDHTTADQAQ